MAKGPYKSGLDPEDLSAADLEEKAVENFSFHVSPNIRADEAEESPPVTPTPKSRRSPAKHRRPQSSNTEAETTTPESTPREAQEELPPLARKTAVSNRMSNRPQAKPRQRKRVSPQAKTNQTATTDRSKRNPKTKGRLSLWRRRPALTISLGFHSVLILMMSFMGFAITEPDNFLLWASTPPNEPIDEFQDLEIESQLELEELETPLPTQLEDSGMASLGEVATDSLLPDHAELGPIAGDSIGDWGSMFGEEGSGLDELGSGQGNALTSFFGTKSNARRVVFVIDNTGSMRRGGLETVIVEMTKTVEQLDRRQEFYVLFFGDQVYPLFFPRSINEFVRPTKENKQKLRQWLDTVEFCTGGVWQLTQALEAAYKLRPDVVYLLTDGRHWDMVRADYKVEAVRNLRSVANPQGIPVHTLGMGCETDLERDNLFQVARANGGTFREVKVSPAMLELAYAKKRAYHINGPGTVWGTLVRQRN